MAKRTRRVVILSFMAFAILTAAAVAAEDAPPGSVDFPIRQPDWPRDWSPLSYGFLRIPGLGGLADLPANPALAGDTGSLGEWGERSIAVTALPRKFESSPAWKPRVFGGMAGSSLFGGFRLAGGAIFDDWGPLVPFVAADLVAEYDRVEGEGSKDLSGVLACGLLGRYPLPWVFAGRSIIGDAPEAPFGSINLEIGDVLVLFEGGQILRAGASLGFEVQGVEASSGAVAVRGLLEYEGRDFRGAFARGLAARLYGESVDDLFSEHHGVLVGLDSRSAVRFGDFAGLSLFMGGSYHDAPVADWGAALRGPRTASGDLGLRGSLELSLLFARGRLLMNEKLPVEFLLKGFLDGGLIRADGTSRLDSLDARYLGAGGELLMLLERSPRDSLRISAGYDLSALARGLSAASGGGVELLASFSFGL